MADLVNEMLGKFSELAQEEKNINADIDKALKEYNDYCRSSDNDLNKKLEEIRKKIRKVSELMQYAREHASDLEEAQMPFETSEGALESIRQTIKLDSKNDPNAESLYTKASGQKLFYEAEIERTRKLIEGSKVQAKRQYDSDVAALEGRKEKHDKALRDYVLSEDFKRYLQFLGFDKSAFNSQNTVNLIDKSKISIGQRRIRFSVPMEVEQELTNISNGEYNPASRTIGAPFGVPTQEGSVLMLEYDERNKAYLLGGVERLLLNLIKYCGTDITDMVYFDPTNNNAESLGIMSAFAKGINPFIVAPQSPAEANSKLSELYAAIKESPSLNCVSRVIVLCGFPEDFGPEFSEKIIDLAKNIKQSGAMLILIHNGSAQDSDVVTALRNSSINIRSRNGSFYLNSTRESLFWYSKPSDIPDTIRRTYIEQRRAAPQPAPVQPTYAAPQPAPVQPTYAAPQPAPVQPTYAAPQPSPQPPAAAKADEVPQTENSDVSENEQEVSAFEETEEISAEKGSRVLPKISVSAGTERLDISGNVTYICGKNSADRTAIVKAVLDGVTAYTHPDSAELWLFDNDHSLIELINAKSAHIKYAVSDEADETAADLAEMLVAEKAARAELLKEKHCRNYDELAKDVYLPRVIAVISDFTEFLKSLDRAPKYFGKNRRNILKGLMKNCSRYGINFVLIGSTFSENGKAPDVLENAVDCAAAVSGREKYLNCLFNDSRIPVKIPENHVLVSGTNALAKIKITEQYEEKNYVQSYEYDANAENYLEKKPFIADRSTAVAYTERDSSRAELIAVRENSEIMLFLGEPCRISGNLPIILREDNAENLLELAPKSSEKAAAATVAAALRSLEEQGIPTEIITVNGNSIFTELSVSGVLSGIKVVESEDAAARIKELSSKLSTGTLNEFLIILGGDVLLTSLHAEDQNSVAELKKLLVKGSKNGCRIMFVCSGISQMQTGFLSLFRHKIIFPCPFAESEKLALSGDCELINGAFRVSEDGDEFTAVPYVF